MRIAVNTGVSRWSILEPRDFKELSLVLVDRCSPADANAALGGLGLIEGEYAWIDIEQLAHALKLDGDAAEAFASMIRFADSRGWVSVDGHAVRAHVVPGRQD
jgi:hypothetical protein